jgi:hypothetical protein
MMSASSANTLSALLSGGASFLARAVWTEQFSEAEQQQQQQQQQKFTEGCLCVGPPG